MTVFVNKWVLRDFQMVCDFGKVGFLWAFEGLEARRFSQIILLSKRTNYSLMGRSVGMRFWESSYFFLLCLILGHLITIFHMVCENGQDRFEYFEIFEKLNIYFLHICMIWKNVYNYHVIQERGVIWIEKN